MLLYRLLVRHLIVRTLLMLPGGPHLLRALWIFLAVFAAGALAVRHGVL